MRLRTTTSESRSDLLTKLERSNESGYALLLVMFFMALLVVSLAAVAPNSLSQGRREKEEEMIWRGKQYERGIKLFYLKNHRLPASIETLTNPNLGQRFMRKAYKDPMNAEDGSWRLIYLGSNGQLIGSTRPSVVFTLGVPGGGGPPSQNTPASSGLQIGSRSGFDSQNGGSSFGTRSISGSFTTQSTGTPPQSTDNPPAPAPSPSSQGESGSQIFGGNIIGVGSKVNGNSMRWLNGAKNYQQFEFIWDLSKEGMGVNTFKLANPQTGNSDQQSPVSSFGQSNGLRSGGQTPPSPEPTPVPAPDPNPQ